MRSLDVSVGSLLKSFGGLLFKFVEPLIDPFQLACWVLEFHIQILKELINQDINVFHWNAPAVNVLNDVALRRRAAAWQYSPQSVAIRRES